MQFNDNLTTWCTFRTSGILIWFRGIIFLLWPSLYFKRMCSHIKWLILCQRLPTCALIYVDSECRKILIVGRGDSHCLCGYLIQVQFMKKFLQRRSTSVQLSRAKRNDPYRTADFAEGDIELQSVYVCWFSDLISESD